MFHGCLRSLPEATLAAREMSPSERHRMLVGSSGWAAGLGMKDAPTPKVHPLDAETASQQPYPITTLQPVYFEAESLSSAKAELRAFSSRLPPRGFDPTFEAVSERIVCTGEKVCREAYLP
ncbi:hypothetical protein T484DRAFT_3006268 [Baffinella frigidus]|nr:hypothetical protein T484DRAFT_3006268 [Cryptophyta sp. CCMP2293]